MRQASRGRGECAAHSGTSANVSSGITSTQPWSQHQLRQPLRPAHTPAGTSDMHMGWVNHGLLDTTSYLGGRGSTLELG